MNKRMTRKIVTEYWIIKLPKGYFSEMNVSYVKFDEATTYNAAWHKIEEVKEKVKAHMERHNCRQPFRIELLKRTDRQYIMEGDEYFEGTAAQTN